MYLPIDFTEKDESVAFEVMERHALAHVITSSAGDTIANLAPVVVTRTDSGLRARFHLARRNPQVRHLAAKSRCLLSFSGPDCYVSSSWYAEQPNVPTWNYLAVQLSGRVEPLTESELEELLRDLAERHEPSVGGSFRYEDLPEAFRRELLREILGFSVEVERVEAKSKLSQNRTPADRATVRERLLALQSPSARAVGEWMRRASRA